MPTLGTPLSPSATRLLMLGAGDRGDRDFGADRARARGIPAPRGRGARARDLALPVRVRRGRVPGRHCRSRLPLHRETGDELLRQGPEPGEECGGRAGAGRVIVEGFIRFDYEITLLTVRHAGGTSFCAPIGHLQVDGDYRESWQPQPMSAVALVESERIARNVTDALGGTGIFGVELLVRGDEAWFSEVSPRPHDTGLVTLVSQDLSEFALPVRAILGLPVPAIRQLGPSASCAILLEGESRDIRFHSVGSALAEPDTQLRLFGKPELR